jgi:hypothetical protein
VTPVLLGILGQGAAGAGGTTAFESIATTTVGSGGASSVTFTESGSAWSAYTHLQLRCIFTNSTPTLDNTIMRFNSDTGSNYYGFHQLAGDGSSASAYASGTTTSSQVAPYIDSSTSFATYVIDILDFKNTNKYKTIRSLGGGDKNGSGGYVWFRSSLWMNTSAINNISIAPSANNFAQYSHFALYGIKA